MVCRLLMRFFVSCDSLPVFCLVVVQYCAAKHSQAKMKLGSFSLSSSFLFLNRTDTPNLHFFFCIVIHCNVFFLNTDSFGIAVINRNEALICRRAEVQEFPTDNTTHALISLSLKCCSVYIIGTTYSSIDLTLRHKLLFAFSAPSRVTSCTLLGMDGNSCWQLHSQVLKQSNNDYNNKIKELKLSCICINNKLPWLALQGRYSENTNQA